MGKVILTFESDDHTNLNLLLRELQGGVSFSLSSHGELQIPVRSLRQIGKDIVALEKLRDNHFRLIFADSFFEDEQAHFFDHVITIVLNMQDFGRVRLVDINLELSTYNYSRRKGTSLPLPEMDSPLLGTVLKPYNMDLSMRRKMAKLFMEAGLQFVKEDETVFFDRRKLLFYSAEIQDTMEGRAFYVPNVTHYIYEYRLIEELYAKGIKVVMVNFLTTGFAPIYRLKSAFPDLCIWGHRIGYALLRQVISMQALAKLGVMAGLDFLHIGTPVTPSEIQQKKKVVEVTRKIHLSFLPIFSKTSPEIGGLLLTNIGTRIILLACGFFRNPSTGELEWQRVYQWVYTLRNIH